MMTVNRSVTVKADRDHAFKVFTEGFDTWWPRAHHIGKKPLQKAVIEPRQGGRCFGREADGTECQWDDSLAERSFQGVAEGDLWKRPTPQSNRPLLRCVEK